jgi:2'-5' RNA ligase
MRCFIAVAVDNPLIGPFIGELAEVGAALRPVKPENIHLTLKFLGEVGDDSIDGIKKAMNDSFSAFDVFEASLEGAGAFPSTNYMRVVWIGIKENHERFIEMQKALDKNLVPLGFEPDKRFHPHLTLARVKSQKGKGKLKAFINKNKERSFGKLKVNSVELKRSVLSPKGPTYSTIEEVKLVGG